VHPDALALGSCVLMRIEGLGSSDADLGLWLELRAAMNMHLEEVDAALRGLLEHEESPAELLEFRRRTVEYLVLLDQEIVKRFPPQHTYVPDDPSGLVA
jgi:hypothetical protein